MTGRGKKHKRGARGSTEEETTTPKRSNMATSLGQDEDVSPETHQPANEQQKPEPTLFELHEMLVDTQISVNNILRENKEIRLPDYPTDQRNSHSQNLLAKNGQSIPRGRKTTLCSEKVRGRAARGNQ